MEGARGLTTLPGRLRVNLVRSRPVPVRVRPGACVERDLHGAPPGEVTSVIDGEEIGSPFPAAPHVLPG